MLSFEFSEEQEAFRATMRDFASRELAPYYLERSRHEELPKELLRRLGELGLTGLMVSPEWGGSGADAVTMGIAAEEMARADFNLSYLGLASSVGHLLVEKQAKETVKKKLLPGIVKGEILLSVALTEPGAGSDAVSMTTTARRVEGGWRLHGEKTSISTIGHASYIITFAKTDVQAGHRGISAFVVPVGTEGISIQRFRDHGFRPITRGAIAYDDVFVPEDHLLGEEGRAFRMIMNTFDFTRAIIGLTAVACAQAEIENVGEYGKIRTTFGRPIIQYQGVAFPLVEYATQLEAARWLCYRALWLRDRGLPHTKEAAMCKWWCPALAVETLNYCVTVYGHVAYSEEHPAMQKLRDVAGSQIGDGTAQIQKLVIAREMFGREYTPL